MSATYSDIVDAMVSASKRGLSAEKVVLTEESINTFLTDDDFTEEDLERQKDEIGVAWRISVESGERNYLVTESGEEIEL